MSQLNCQHHNRVISRYGMRQRASRLRDRIARNIQHLTLGQATETYKLKHENLGLNQPFGTVYDRLADIYNHQQLLSTKMKELYDANLKPRIMKEAKGCNFGTSAEEEQRLLAQTHHALESLECDLSVTEPTAMGDAKAAAAIRKLREHLGRNNAKFSEGIELYRFRGAVDLVGPRSGEFQELLSSEDRQFALVQMLAELDCQDVKNAYLSFAKDFADLRTEGIWSAKDCDTYEEGLIKQERLVFEALSRERKHRPKTQLSTSTKKSQVAGKPSQKSLIPNCAGNQTLNQRDQIRNRRPENPSLFHARPTCIKGAKKQSQDFLNLPGSKHNGKGVLAPEMATLRIADVKTTGTSQQSSTFVWIGLEPMAERCQDT